VGSGNLLEVASPDSVAAPWVWSSIRKVAAAHGAADGFLTDPHGAGGVAHVNFGIEPGRGGSQQSVDEGSPGGSCLVGSVVSECLRLALGLLHKFR
jgi:hypothetical protein